VSGPVCLEELRNVGDKRVIGVGIRQEGADTQQDLTDRKGRTPLVLENVEANAAIRINVAVINACGEVYLGRLEGIVSREVNVEEEDTT
jgi:hypothetical protein